MKRFLCLLLVLVFVPLVSFSDSVYSSKLNMTMQDFVEKYNMIGASLDSPLKALENPYRWTKYNKYNVAWFQCDKKSNVILLLESSDPASDHHSLSCGLDCVQIAVFGTENFLSHVAVASRAFSLFAPNILGLDSSYYLVGNLMKEYYDNNCFEKNMSYQRQVEADGSIVVRFYNDSGYYYFDIVSISDL